MFFHQFLLSFKNMTSQTNENHLVHKLRSDLLISCGKIAQEDKAWDIAFWQQTDFSERALIAMKMAEDAFSLKTGTDTSQLHFSRDHVETGSMAERNKEYS